MLSSRATMLLILQGSIAMSDTIIIGVLTIAASVLTSYFTGKSTAAEWKGAINQKFVNIETKFGEIDADQSAQWTDINKANNGVSNLDGQLSTIKERRRYT